MTGGLIAGVAAVAAEPIPLAAASSGSMCSEWSPEIDEHSLAAIPVPEPGSSTARNAAAWELPTSATTIVSGSMARPGIP